MKTEHAEEYTQSLGQIVAGGWRQIALGEQLGVPKALGLTTREWVEQRLGGYVRLSVAERHGAVKELTDDGLSTRRIADVVGVSHETVAGDVRKLTPGQNGDSTNAEPIDVVAALAVGRVKDKQTKRREREDRLREERRLQEQTALGAIDDFEPGLSVADLREWRPEGVSAIVTDPPYVGESLPLYEALADFAVDVLPDGGGLVVMTWQPILADVIRVMERPELVYRWCLAWTFGTSERTPNHQSRVFDGWKPVLVYHKSYVPDDATYLYDVIVSEDKDKELHEWGQSLEGFQRLVKAVSEPGDLVCDPFLGAGTTAVAALSQARLFTGCDIDAGAIETTKQRLNV
jgi:hypothetical protein